MSGLAHLRELRHVIHFRGVEGVGASGSFPTRGALSIVVLAFGLRFLHGGGRLKGLLAAASGGCGLLQSGEDVELPRRRLPHIATVPSEVGLNRDRLGARDRVCCGV